MPHDARAAPSPMADGRGLTNPASKPLDVGNGRLAASFGRTNASLLSLLTVDPRHGSVELLAAPPFDESRRGDPEATRAYRQRLTDDRFACLWLETTTGDLVQADRLEATDPLRPRWTGRIGKASVEVEAWPTAAGIEIEWRFDGGGAVRVPGLRAVVAGRLDLPALAEITETDPVPPGGVGATVLRAERSRLVVAAPGLTASMVIDAPDGGAWAVDGGTARLDVPVGSDGPHRTVRVQVSLRPEEPAGDHVARRSAKVRLDPPARRLVERALAYVRGCTCLRLAADERVLLTDHRLLPLSWTRDAYYQALLLLAADGPGDRDRVAGHLRWLWRRCARPDGRWMRSNHADGRPKDRGFQADQQLFPLIELADYWRRSGTVPEGVDWTAAVRGAWSAAVAAIDPDSGLIASYENPADDVAGLPFLLGSQIVLWYAAQRIAEIAASGAIDLDVASLVAVGERTRDGVARHFLDGDRWSDATDLAGHRSAYRDANDLPVALAPIWGFCRPHDPIWRATMVLALGPDNPGYASGPRGGLGSAHTDGAWTLGDVQAWIVARVARDERGQARAIKRLAQVAFEDGMLPEAYSTSREPDIRVRHWFAWPGSVLGALLLLDARGDLETFLEVAR